MKYLFILGILFLFFSTNCLYGQYKRDQYIDSANQQLSLLKNYTALTYYEKALRESKKSKDSLNIASDLLSIAKTQQKISEMDQALKTNLEALRLIDKLKEYDTLRFTAMIQLSIYFMEFENLPKAEKYLNEAGQIAKRKDDAEILGRYYNYRGVYERRKGNYLQSIEYYKKAMEITPEKLSEEQFVNLISLSTAYGYNKDYKLARNCLAEAEKLNEKIQSDLNAVTLYGQIGKIEFLMGNENAAIKYCEKGLVIAKERKHLDFIERYNRELARIYHKKGDYQKAYNYYSDFVKQYTENMNKQNGDVIAELSTRYELEKNEQKINYLETQRNLENLLYQSKLKRRNQIIGLTSLIGVIILLLAIWMIRSQRNKQKVHLELIQKEREIQDQKSILKGQEAERNRLSRELHDGLGGALASIKLKLSTLQFEQRDKILKEVDDAYEEVRNVSHSLNSTHIRNTNFHALIEHFVQQFEQRSSIKVQFDFFPEEPLNQLNEEYKHHCYRIYQELTANIIKHTDATKATIALVRDDNDVILLVEDNGQGFEHDNKNHGIGLRNIRERVEKINGILEVHSKVGNGTSISVRFPYVKKSDEDKTIVS